MNRRTMLASMTLALGLHPGARALARCAPISLAQEVAQCRYVVEAEVLSVETHGAVLRVIASWKGTPPAQVTVSFSGRSHPFRRAESTPVIAFLRGSSDEHLDIYRCGATNALTPEIAAELTALGLRRTPR